MKASPRMGYCIPDMGRDHMSVLASVRVVAELEDKPAIQSIVVRVNLAHHRSLTVRE